VQGPSGVIASVFAAGDGGDPTNSLTFLGPTVVVSVQAGHRVHVVAHKAMGAGASAANSLNIYVCHRPNGTMLTPTSVGGGIFGLGAPANTRLDYGISAVISNLAASTYDVGMCGSSADAANWTNNEWGYTSALVYQS
jgi:hypothetical protein